MISPAEGAGDQKMASERNPSTVQALMTLAGMLSALARVASNSMEGTRGTSSSNLPGPQHSIFGCQSDPSTSEGSSPGR